MPLNVPDLDDLTFNDLVEEALAMLPHYAPEWTDHNASDPGVTLIELLAYFTEALIYRLNRITRATRIDFLKLLTGTPSGEGKDFDDLKTDQVRAALHRAVSALREPQRAVTASDYETIAGAYAEEHLRQKSKHIRVRCFEQSNLEDPDPLRRSDRAPGHVSLVVVPDRRMTQEALHQVLIDIRRLLEPKCLLTTRLHVVAPSFLWFKIRVEIHPLPHVAFDDVRKRAAAALLKHFNPFAGGGPDGTGWPFGRTLFLTEIYGLLDQVPGVDYVHAVHLINLAEELSILEDAQRAVGIQIGVRATVGHDARLGGGVPGPRRLVCDRNGSLMAVELRPYELVGMAEPLVILKPVAEKNPMLHKKDEENLTNY